MKKPTRSKAAAAVETPAKPAGPRAMAPVEAVEAVAEVPEIFEGFVEHYGRQQASGCWVFCGWVSRSWMLATNREVTATFERGAATGDVQAAFFEREDLTAQNGVGFLLLLPTAQGRLGALLRLRFNHRPSPDEIVPLAGIQEEANDAIVERALATLTRCPAGPENAAIRSLLTRRIIGDGYLDAYGYHSPSIGWFIWGWVSNEWIACAGEGGEVVAQFERGTAAGAAVLNYYEREDIRDVGLGFILHLSATKSALGQLLVLKLRAGDAVVVIRPSMGLETIPGDRIARHVLELTLISDHGAARDALQALAARAAHDGRDTIGSLSPRMFIDFDEVILCTPDCVLLFGWMLAWPGAIKAMRLRSGANIYPMDTETGFLWFDRHDVIDSVGRDNGFHDPRCGFIARVPTPEPLEGDLYLEVETPTGEAGIKPLPRSRLDGLPAMKRALGEIETQYAAVDSIYDHILGPAIGALNARRLSTPPRVKALQFGPPVQAPRHSVIVPLYGRIDFMEIQLALFATLGIGADVEIIYVLDDPSLTRESQFKAASLYERFRIPFRLLSLSHNVGFAPANNLGLQASGGDYICFMNSDVFPTTGDWLDRLAMHLEEDASLGVVGPVLLFEDDSVQHQGMAFKNLPEFGNWAFPIHKHKGFRPPNHTRLVREAAITGACMVLRREHALAHGGFDPAFVIGDFEDTDLCFKLAAEGLYAAVDFGVRMYHLERKSQASSANTWRVNLTVYNAWLHQRRWADAIERLQVTA